MPNPVCLDQLQLQVSEWRRNNLSIGFTCGAFDILHAGHVDYLRKARALCDRLIVAVNSDRSIRAYKDPLRPINAEIFRLEVVSALACVDAVTLMHDLRPEFLISSLRPDFYIKGGDYRADQLRSAPLVRSYGGKCVIIQMTHETSSSAIIRRIQELSAYADPVPVNPAPAQPIVFLDRDGTLIRNVPFLNSPAQVELLPGVGEGLRALQDRGFRLVVVTNQQGIGLGYFSYEEFTEVNSQMLRLLSDYNVQISRFYFCPHSMADRCDCRKPKSRLLQDALHYFGADPSECFFIGDSLSDAVCAERVRCRPILLSTSQQPSLGHTAGNFADAVDYILNSVEASVSASALA